MIVGLVDTAIQLSYWSNSEGNPITAEDTFLLTPTMAGTTTMLPLQFSQLHTSHAGQYFCRVSVYISEISVQQNNSLVQTIVVQSKQLTALTHYTTYIICLFSFTVPEPIVTIKSSQDENFLAGSYLRFNCSIELHPAVDTQVAVTNLWQRNEMVISSNSRIVVSQPTALESRQYESYIEFNTLSSAMDSGIYMCAVATTPSILQEYIISGSGAASYIITVVGKQ